MGSIDASASGTTAPAPARTREDVVTAASKLFASRGFHGTSMRDLGEELGMLGSSIYSHVRGKNELLVEVIARGTRFFNGVVVDAEAAGGSAKDRLRHLVNGHVNVVVRHIDESRTFLFESRFLPEDDRSRIIEMRDAYEAAYRQAIRDGIEEGSFAPDIDPGMTAIFILSILNALIRWYRPSGNRDADDIGAEMWAFIESGVVGSAA